MKLIINTTTLSGTGVTQVAVSFINECKKISNNEYHIFLSRTVLSQINKKTFPSNFYFYDFDSHPLYGLNGFKIRRQLRELERKINPDAVFTVFGPACWTPRSPHLTGFANSYYVYPDSVIFKKINFHERWKLNFMKFAHFFFLKRNGKFYVCETEDMAQRLSKYLPSPLSNVFTVSNIYSSYYNNFKIKKILPEKLDDKEFRLLTLASFAFHKNQLILNEVIPILNNIEPNKRVLFVLTIDNNIFQEKFSDIAKKNIINLGRVDIQDCPNLYLETDALFLPTLIESFSANYPESMKMKRPILTSDYSFAHSICKDAALYFNPLDPNDIAEKIISIIYDQDLYDKIVSKGLKRLKDFGTAKSRAENYLKILKSISKSPKK